MARASGLYPRNAPKDLFKPLGRTLREVIEALGILLDAGYLRLLMIRELARSTTEVSRLAR